ncbi:MAG: thiamine pyrophosphate-dependent enzyme, partial [Phycisphaerales bacterium]|nr:thiamine pyrophosphate-dependent enzyme [Phycisphaerales bacterium]
GAAYALEDKDWMVTCYRENAGLFWRGVDPEKILLHWMGDERGNNIPVRATPLAIPIGTQMLHAVGLGWASKYRGEDGIACTFFGDGATSEGDFHEAMNFAANLDLPVVFVCQNNSWAISTPTAINCSAPTLAQRGLAYGMHCVQVDGNDLFAMVKVIRDAASRARTESRPTFIEAITYRLGDHTTADDARRYREQDVVDEWAARDPMIRLRKWLEQRDLWDEGREQALRTENEIYVKDVVERAEGIEPPTTDDMFTWMYSETPPVLDLQRRTLRTSSLGQGIDGSGS